MEKLIIGRKEIADLPSFGLMNKTVKIDSGAYTSSIDIVDCRVENDILYVQFEKNGQEIPFSKFTTKKIKSSNGTTQNRYVIEGTIRLGQENYSTPFSLTDRSDMKYPILLGRKLLNHRFLIDTAKTNQLKRAD